MPGDGERDRLRQTFDQVAEGYDRARPQYPGILFADLDDWEIVYSAEEYIELLGTFSGHLAMADWQRDRLFGEIRRRLAQRGDQSVRRGWGAVLHVARRRDEP